ncbi:MAG: hypothetical protein PHD51_03260 [Patescibacteria group bacterium]|nr:hypothetical protein [Patescibacteria group bacterium]MDD5491003.1 hypothetical protein [Patescibacteria group bacterium]
MINKTSWIIVNFYDLVKRVSDYKNKSRIYSCFFEDEFFTRLRVLLNILEPKYLSYSDVLLWEFS